MDTGANDGCPSGDCEAEDQEDPSSCLPMDTLEISDATDVNNIEDDDGMVAEATGGGSSVVATNGRSSSMPDNIGEEELAAFRLQWQRELEAMPPPQRVNGSNQEEAEPATDEERAKKYFMKGTELERAGKWYLAIQQYKRAMAIMPDVERRLYESTTGMETPPEEPETVEEIPVNTNTDEDDDEEAVEGEEVVARLLRIQARRGLVIMPAVPTRATHISCLPYEVVLTVLRWVVSTELDAVSLESAGATCRALHVAARDPDLWRALAVRTWGVECGIPRHHGAMSWRGMFVARPRLQLHGCYISRTTYLRHGENSFQDQFYQPWYLIEYYRYLRFFSEGLVLMWTTAEEPAACVQQLRQRAPRPGLGVQAGHYRLIDNKVVIVIKKTNSEKKPVVPSNTRFRSRRREPEQDQTQTFHMELELRNLRGRRNASLAWSVYRVCRRDLWTSFELSPRSYPPFVFSRVRSYALDAPAPL